MRPVKKEKRFCNKNIFRKVLFKIQTSVRIIHFQGQQILEDEIQKSDRILLLAAFRRWEEESSELVRRSHDGGST